MAPRWHRRAKMVVVGDHQQRRQKETLTVPGSGSLRVSRLWHWEVEAQWEKQ
jgi:hypothetical protein